MKSKLILTSLLSIFLLISCKDKEAQKDNSDTVKEQEAPKNNIIVTLSAIVKKDDSFQIYYKYEDSEAFTEENSFFTEFKGKETVQDIVFALPESEFPNYLRLDFGVNKEQGPIEIKNLKLAYNDKVVEIKGNDFFNYFYGNELTEKIDKEKAIVTPILTKEGGYDPMFASADGLREKLEFLIQQ